MQATRILLLAGALCTSVAAWARPLELAAPGTPIALDARPRHVAAADWLAQQRWYGLTLQGNALVVTPVTQLTEASFHSAVGKDADRMLEGAKTALIKPAMALKLAPDSLFAVRILDDNGVPVALPAAAFAGTAPTDVLGQGWQSKVIIAGKAWTLSTRSQQRPDGKLLAGSLEIIGKTEGRAPQVLLPASSGMAFARQELLWIGDIDGDATPDLLVRRMRLTGDVQYVFLRGADTAVLTMPDARKASYYSSGVEPESNTFTWPKDRSPAPFRLTRKGGFSISSAAWQEALGDPLPALPRTLAERQYQLGKETIRFTLEYLPRVGGVDGPVGDDMWAGQVVVRVFFRGRSQVLMEAQAPDDDNFTLSFGTLGTEPGITVDYHPHYNNTLQYHWVYDGERFQQVLATQLQGC
ncbi:hypothetical protein [Massilia sp. CF038]|uniref:hypothetical protein n=1 Tax=Massilia sp. CF038 TaxID=1881045 RepID=UPI00090EF0DD|nr:hypothetical protein [Massilia sp. CF038]SHH15174.1 hypothetical protein SAMN05428948_3042 [Massilia sp. CF038]